MDHLPHPSGAKPIEVPYVCTEAYDLGTFEGYPARKGWKTDSDGELIFWDQEAFDIDEGDISLVELEDFDLSGKEKESMSLNLDDEEEDEEEEESLDDDYDENDILEIIDPFVQSWLFFGVLIEVFGIVGIEVRESDFIRDSDKITTAKLPALIEEWRTKETRLKTEDDDGAEISSSLATLYVHRDSTWLAKRKSRTGRYGLIQAVLAKVQYYVNKHCHSGELGSYGPNVPAWAVEDEISLSIMVLGWTLQRAAYSIYEPDRKWTKESWGINGILTNRLLNNGRWCMGETAKLMSDLEVDGLYYVGAMQCPRQDQHHESCTEMGCSGQGIIGRPYKTQHVRPDCECPFVGVSVTDLIAVISSGDIPLVSWSSESGLKLIPHNPQSKQNYVAISHIWSDGMGNEHDNALPQCQLFRIQALVDELNSNARPSQPQNRVFGPKVFSDSNSLDHSGGFWMDTLCILSDERSKDNAKYKDIRNSSISNMRNIYEGAHRVLVLDKWILEVDRSADVVEKAVRLYLSNWQHRLWTLQEGVLAQNLFFQFQNGQLELDDLWREQTEAKVKVPGLYSAIVQTVLPLVPISNSILKEGEEDNTLAQKFARLLGGMPNRKTSKAKDEPGCVATILGKDPGPILQFRTGDERMLCLLRMINSFPRELVFNELPRLPFEGFRWAPRTFIGQSKSLWARNEAFSEDPESYKVSTYGKLRDYELGGFHARFSGIILHLDNNAFERKFAVTVNMGLQTIHYGVLLVPDNRDDDLQLGSSQKYAIILSEKAPQDGKDVAAIFGIIRPHAGEGKLRVLQHMFVTRFKQLNTSALGRDPYVLRTMAEYGEYFEGNVNQYHLRVVGEWVGENEEWCIV